MRPPGTLRAEREPNDDLAQANRVAPGVPVTGYLGKRRSSTEGDRDVYRVDWPRGTRRVATVALTGLPNLDVNLRIDDSDGVHGAVSDEGRLGEGEVLHRRVVDGPLVISVGQTLAPGQQLPIENVSDAYELTVTEERGDAGEIEPNNLEADATPLAPTWELRGYLDARDDVDLLRWTGPDGRFIVVVRGDGLPFAWRLAGGKPRTPGEATVDLRRGELIRIERTDRSEPAVPLPPKGRDAPWSIVVVDGGRK
jgi:hypothetical protein